MNTYKVRGVVTLPFAELLVDAENPDEAAEIVEDEFAMTDLLDFASTVETVQVELVELVDDLG